MAQRPRLPLPWGQGLDRASGIGVVEPASWSDLRNVVLYDGKAQVRGGLLAIAELEDDGMVAQTDILAIRPFRQRESVLVVAWDQATRIVSVFECASNGQNPVFVDNWFTAEAAIGVPRVLMAESFGRMFLSHEFPLLKPGVPYLRAPTMVYDGTTLAAVTSDLDRNSSAETVRFRGVATYLDYLVGWGYGTGAEEDRAEIVRVSLPGNPTTLDPEHYFLAGQRGDPVIVGVPGPRSFVVFKESELYAIVGTERRNFGIHGPIDPAHGCIGARLAIGWGGVVWFWSFDGPRLTDGGPSTALDLPLDLNAPVPTDLPAEGSPEAAFVVPNPVKRTLEWHWPNEADGTTRVYVAHVRDFPRSLKWSYDVLGRRIRCGAVLYPVAQTAPPGQPQYRATGILTFGANPSDTQTVTIDGKVYTFQATLTNSDGNVQIGADAEESLDNLIAAITLGAGAGTAYAAATTEHTTVTAAAADGDTMLVTAKDQGTAGNSIATTTTVGSATWSGATLAGGAAGVSNITATGFRLNWNNVGALGDEITEVWLRNTTDAGAWTKVAEYAYESAAMQKDLNGVLEAEDDFAIALRHRRGALYNAGAELTGSPTSWPLAGQEAFTAAAVGAASGWFDLTDTISEFFGGKEYTRHEVQWEQPADTSRGWEIWENTVNDFGTASVQAHGKNHNPADPDSGLVTRSCETSGCVTTDQLVQLLDPAPVQDYYYWVVYVDGGTWAPGTGFGGSGARSVETPLADNPINYAAAP